MCVRTPLTVIAVHIPLDGSFGFLEYLSTQGYSARVEYGKISYEEVLSHRNYIGSEPLGIIGLY